MFGPTKPPQRRREMPRKRATPRRNLIDLAALSPVERIALADALYDGAMQEIERLRLSPEQLAELDRRIAEVEHGRAALCPWSVAGVDRPVEAAAAMAELLKQ